MTLNENDWTRHHWCKQKNLSEKNAKFSIFFTFILRFLHILSANNVKMAKKTYLLDFSTLPSLNTVNLMEIVKFHLWFPSRSQTKWTRLCLCAVLKTNLRISLYWYFSLTESLFDRRRRLRGFCVCFGVHARAIMHNLWISEFVYKQKSSAHQRSCCM